MTFISKTDAREREQAIVPHDPLLHGETSFGEVFAASVGHVFDEGLSISAGLNNDAYAQRDDVARQMVDNGFDMAPYTDQTGVIDFDKLQSDTENPDLMTNRELYDQRNELLAKRRAYSNDVKARGSGLAQFTGDMVGYMLDPVNVISMPLGAAATSLRGLSTLARVGRVAAVEGAIGIAAETAIQPLVWEHKSQIGSPYEIDDALMAIGSAAIGGAALGGTVAGVAGFLRNVLNLPYPDTPGVAGAVKELNRMVENIESNPVRGVSQESLGRSARKFFQMDNEELSQQIILMRRETLDGEGEIALEAAEAVFESRRRRWSTTVEGERQAAIDEEVSILRSDEETRLPRGERKALSKELQDLQAQRNAVVEADPVIVKEKGVSARKAKSDAQALVRADADAQRAQIQSRIDGIESRLAASKAGETARSGLSRVQQGIFPKRLQAELNRIENRRMVEVDINYLRRLEETRKAQSDILPVVEPDKIKTVERALDDYDAEINDAYSALGVDSIVVRDGGEVLNAREFIAEQDDIMDGLESVRVCGIG